MLTQRFTTAVVFLALLQSAALSFAAGPDPIRDGLEKAKVTRTDERAKAKAGLVATIDAQIKTAGGAGDLEGLKALTAQKDAMVSSGVVPNLPALKVPAGEYILALRKADGELVAAYETAIQAYANAQKAAEADALRKERQQVLNSSGSPYDSPEAFTLTLDRAKSDYTTSINDGRKAYVQAIASRIEAATRSGDLNAVTRLKAAQTAAENDQPLPDGMTDAAVVGARVRFGNAIQSANTKLAQAYRDSIRGLTKSNTLDQATAVQAEFDATGLNGTAAGARTPAAGGPAGATADNNNNLAKILPPYLAATGTYGVEKEGGILLADKCTIATNAADFLSKDFIFDVTVFVPKENHGIEVGIGDTTDEGSVRVVIYDDGGWGRLAHFAICEQWGKKMGKIHTGETIVIRLERHEGPITASIGTITDGKFVAEFTQTVADPKKASDKLSERRAKLYFEGHARFTRVRLATGAAAARAEAGADAAQTATIVKLPASSGPAAPVAPQVAVAPAPVAPVPTLVAPVTPVAPPPAVAPVAPPAVPPVAPNPNPPAVGGAPAKIPAASLIAVGTLESKKAPQLKDVPGRLVFSPPNHDKTWTGANGVSIPAGASWSKTGTTWICEEFFMRPWGATFVHPFGNGHILIQVGESGVLFRNDGKWAEKKSGTALPLTPAFQGKFPLRDKKVVLRSELAADGTYKLFVDDALVTTTKVTEGKPMDFSIFKGPGLPASLAAGHAAVIVDHGFRFTSVAGDLSLYPAK